MDSALTWRGGLRAPLSHITDFTVCDVTQRGQTKESQYLYDETRDTYTNGNILRYVMYFYKIPRGK